MYHVQRAQIEGDFQSLDDDVHQLIRDRQCDEVKPLCGACFRRFPIPKACNYGLLPSSRKADPARARPLAPRTERPQSSSSKYPSDSVSASQSEGEWDWKVALPEGLRQEMLDPFETHPASVVAGIDVLMKHCMCSTSSPWHSLILDLPDLSQISRLRYIDVSPGNRHQKPIPRQITMSPWSGAIQCSFTPRFNSPR
jgi:hypothetical protein